MAASVISTVLLVLGAVEYANGGFPRGGRTPRYARGALRPRDLTGYTYTTSSRDSTADKSFGATDQRTTVSESVTQWLSGRGTHNFYGNVECHGEVVVSQTDYLKTASTGGQTCKYDGHTSTNGNLFTAAGGKISLNDFNASTAAMYDWNLYTMQNNGTLQMCGRGDTGGSTYQLYCDLDCYNYGLIDMGQYYGNQGASFVWRNTNLSAPGATSVQNTYNQGAFRISNLVYHNVQNVLGDGCYVIDNAATLYLEDGSGYYQNANFGPTFPNQTIHMTDRTGCLHMDTQVYSHNSNFGPQVYGYGAGNAIEFYETLSTTSPYTYDSVGGVLTCNMNSGNLVNIKIGVGYDASLFYTAKNPTNYNTAGYNAIFYRGTMPTQTTPSVCSVTEQSCADPETTNSLGSAYYATTTVPYSGTDTFTGTVTTTVVASGTNSGIVEVITPNAYVTTTTTSSGASSAYTTTIAQVGTTPGTVLVVAPATSRPSVASTTVGPNQCVCRPR